MVVPLYFVAQHKFTKTVFTIISHFLSAPKSSVKLQTMNLSNAAALLLASAITAGAFVPSTLRNDIARFSVREYPCFVPNDFCKRKNVFQMSEGAVIEAETVVEEGEKYE